MVVCQRAIMRIVPAVVLALACLCALPGAYAQDEGIDPSKVDQFDHQIAVPAGPFSVVNTASGTLTTTVPLLQWQARGGMPVGMTLQHSSGGGSRHGDAALGWQHSYQQSIFKWPMTLHWQWGAPGFVRNWQTTSTTAYDRCPGNPDDFAPMTDGYQVTTKDQTRYQFTQNAYNGHWTYLTKIIDTHSNQISLKYRTDKQYLVDEVADQSGRDIEFNWYVAQLMYRLTSVKDARDRTYSFTYGDPDNAALLTKITFPTPGSPSNNPAFYIKFDYDIFADGQWRITTIKTPDYDHTTGGELTWTYTYDRRFGLGHKVLSVVGPDADQGRNSTSPTETKVTFEYPLAPACYVHVGGKTYTQTIVRNALWQPGDENDPNKKHKNREVHLYSFEDGDQETDRDYYFGRMIAYVVHSQSSSDTNGSEWESDLTEEYPGCYYEKYHWNAPEDGWWPYQRFDGTIQSFRDADNHSWTYNWGTDHRLNLSCVTDPDGHSTHYYYDAPSLPGGKQFARVGRVVDGSNHTTSYVYNSTYDLTETHQDPYGLNLTTTNTYDTYGNLDTATDTYGNQVQYTYDPDRHTYVIKEKNLQTGVFTEYGDYDVMGNRGYSTAPRKPGEDPLKTTYEYDYANRLGKVVNPDGTSSAIARDPYGNETWSRDEGGNVVEKVYDDLGHLIETTTFPDVTGCSGGISSSDGWQIRYCYDQLGTLKWLDWEDGWISYSYDERNRLLLEKMSENKPSWYKYKYDGSGKVIRRLEGINPNNTNDSSAVRVLDFTYYDSGKPYQDKLGSTVLVSRTYNGDGTLSGVSSAGDSVQYAYDNADRETFCYQSIPGKTVQHVYQADSRPGRSHTVGVNVYSGCHLSVLGLPTTPIGSYFYEYADGGNLAFVTSPGGDEGGPSTLYEYNGYGGLLSKTILDTRRPSPQVTYKYEKEDNTAEKDRLRLRNLTNERNDGSIISSFTYDYDHIGNKTRITEANGDHTDYSYDDTSRLRHEIRYTASGSSVYSYCYSYDRAGNRKAKVLTNSQGTQTFSASYIGNNLLDYIGGPRSCSFSYNNYGELTGKATSQDTWAYAYEGIDGTLGLMTSVTKNGAVVAQYAYDPLKRRAQKISASGTARYVYAGDQMIAETDSSGNIVAWYTPGVCESRYVAGNWTTHYYTVDGLGSTHELTDDLQRVTDAYSYNAWGEEQAQLRPSGEVKNPLRFVGKSGYYSDDETGLVLLGVRYYDPLIGRFITPDPSRDGLNWYAYADGNPVNAVDPTGRVAQKLDKMGGSQVGKAINLIALVDKKAATGLRGLLKQGKIRFDMEMMGLPGRNVGQAITLGGQFTSYLTGDTMVKGKRRVDMDKEGAISTAGVLYHEYIHTRQGWTYVVGGRWMLMEAEAFVGEFDFLSRLGGVYFDRGDAEAVGYVNQHIDDAWNDMHSQWDIEYGTARIGAWLFGVEKPSHIPIPKK